MAFRVAQNLCDEVTDTSGRFVISPLILLVDRTDLFKSGVSFSLHPY